MPDDQKTRDELIEELNVLRGRIAEFERNADGEQTRQGEDSENTFKMVFDNAPDGMLLADTETRKFRMANSALCRELGYTQQEIVRLGVADIHPAEDLPYVVSQFEKQARGEILVAADIPVKRRDGSVFYADISSVETTLVGRSHLMGIFRDVTDRKRVEKELWIRSAAIESSISALGITDLEGKIVYVNQACVDMWGYKDKSDMIGRHLPEFWEGDRVFQTIKNLEGKGVDAGEDIGRRRDGSLFNVLFAASVIRDEKGRPSATLGSFIDITERRKAEEELRQSEERYRRFFEHDLTGDFISAPDGALVDCNQAFLDIFGFQSLKEAKSTNMESVYPTPAARKVMLDKIREEKIIVNYEHEARKITGEAIFIAQNTVGEFDDDNNLVLIRGYILDITERRNAEQALRQSEEILRSIIDHSVEVFYIHDTEHKLTYVSPQSQETLGYTPEEMMVKWTTLTTDDPINDEGFRLTNRAMETGERQAPYLLEVKRKDGELRIVEIDESPVKDENGNVVAVTGGLRDVTERRQAQKALLLSEQKYRNLIANIPDVIWTTDSEGNTVFISPNVERVYGYTPQEIYDQNGRFIPMTCGK
ncbi:MAG: PAS domain-containing protein [Planctomycetota bacterium]|jgi:PAS domain S-box-containing protein